MAYLVANRLGGTTPVTNGLYSLALATGTANFPGTVSGVNGIFRDIAVRDVRAVPEPGSALLLALGGVVYLRRRRAAR